MAAILLVGVVGLPLLPVAPLPQVDFPTIQVSAQLPAPAPRPWRPSVATPLERQFAADPRRDADDIDERARHDPDHRAIRPPPQHRRRGAGRPDGDQCRRRPAAEEPAVPADLSEGQSGRLADPVLRPDLGHAAADRGRRLCREYPGAADLADLRGSRWSDRRPAEAGVRIQVDPAKLASLRPSLEDVRDRDRQAPPSMRRRARSTARRAASPSTTTTSAQGRRTGTTSSSPIERRAGPRPRYRHCDRRAGETSARGLVRRQRRHPPAVFKQPGANVIDTVDAHQGSAAAPEASIPPASRSTILSDRTQTIRASVADVQFTLLLTIGLVVMVIFLFLRNFWATIIPGVTVPLSLSAPSRSCTCSATASTISR